MYSFASWQRGGQLMFFLNINLGGGGVVKYFINMYHDSKENQTTYRVLGH